MKQAILTLIQLALTAGGGSLTTSGITTDGEAQTLIGAIMTIAGIVWVIIERHQRAKAAAKAAAQAAGIIAPCIALFLISNFVFLISATGCATWHLSSAQKENIANALIEVAKFGLKFGLNAIAKNNPSLAPFVPNLEARFQITFSDAAATANPEAFALAIRADVLATVADPEAQKQILSLLAGAVRDQTDQPDLSAQSDQTTAAGDPAQRLYALRVAEALVR